MTNLNSRAACDMKNHGRPDARADCCRPDSPAHRGERRSVVARAEGFWKDAQTWTRASRNTLNCLIGCSLGDFGMLIFLQVYYPATPMFLAMALAMTSGLISSILLEASILRSRESFTWAEAFHTAFGMSLISMLGMELAENATDWLLTRGSVPISDPWYWTALGVSLMVGFFATLPYNYYKLRRHGRACH